MRLAEMVGDAPEMEQLTQRRCTDLDEAGKALDQKWSQIDAH